jgi:predicted RNase H-like nuclease (RuvC/YqgF family)
LNFVSTVICSEFQDFVNTLETELLQVKEQWREECTKNATLTDRIAQLEAELVKSNATSAKLRNELAAKEDAESSAALQNFVRGYI